MKIKTFEFIVNCFAGSFTREVNKEFYTQDTLRDRGVLSPSEIDATVNNFCEDKDVVAITDNFYSANRHNNGGDDTVIRSIMVVYK